MKLALSRNPGSTNTRKHTHIHAYMAVAVEEAPPACSTTQFVTAPPPPLSLDNPIHIAGATTYTRAGQEEEEGLKMLRAIVVMQVDRRRRPTTSAEMKEQTRQVTDDENDKIAASLLMSISNTVRFCRNTAETRRIKAQCVHHRKSLAGRAFWNTFFCGKSPIHVKVNSDGDMYAMVPNTDEVLPHSTPVN